MSKLQRADPIARRRAVLLVVIGSLVGGLALVVFQRYQPLLEQWLLSDPNQLAHRLTIALVFFALVTATPLFAFAALLWVRTFAAISVFPSAWCVTPG